MKLIEVLCVLVLLILSSSFFLIQGRVWLSESQESCEETLFLTRLQRVQDLSFLLENDARIILKKKKKGVAMQVRFEKPLTTEYFTEEVFKTIHSVVLHHSGGDIEEDPELVFASKGSVMPKGKLFLKKRQGEKSLVLPGYRCILKWRDPSCAP